MLGGADRAESWKADGRRYAKTCRREHCDTHGVMPQSSQRSTKLAEPLWLAVLLLFLVLPQLVFWWLNLTQTHRVSVPGELIAIESVLLMYNIASVGFFAWRGATLPLLMLSLVSTLSQLLANFSWFYWLYGGVGNFTKPLTHLDAVYFAVGTLSTAGTGSLSATSETARGIQMAQMLLDLGLTLLVLGVVVARYAVPARSRMTGGDAASGSQSPGHEADKA
jgi:hypothetical protein